MRIVRAIVVLGAWAGAAGVSLFAAATTKVGPNVMHLWAQHGVHAGDLVVAVTAASAAALVTLVAYEPRR